MPAKPRPKLAMAVVGFGLLLTLDATLHGSQLVYPLTFGWRLCAFLGGLLIGLLGALDIADRLESKGWRGLVGAVMLPLLCGFAGTYAARRAFELQAFVNFKPTARLVYVPVINMHAGKSGTTANVKLDFLSRDVQIYITDELYDRLDAFRYPGRDCLGLIEETGRNGVTRFALPNRFEEGVGHHALVPCAPVSTDFPLPGPIGKSK